MENQSLSVEFDYSDFTVVKVSAKSEEHPSFEAMSSEIEEENVPIASLVQEPSKFCKDEHSGDEQFTCQLCGKQCINKHRLASHKSMYHTLKQCSCKICGKTFEEKCFLYNHINIHKSQNCSSCGKTFKKSSYYQHIKYCKNYICTICDFKTTSRLEFKKHDNQHETKSLKKCTYCNYYSQSKYNIKRHMQAHHTEKYECEKCGKQIPLMSSEKHKETHAKNTCHICGKFFNQLQFDIERHVANHYKKRKKAVRKDQKCTYCAYKSDLKGNLKKHIEAKHLNPRHKTEKKKRCDICNYTFTKSSNLSGHIKKGCPGGRIIVGF